jgi:di/tricarboxylate transporter
MPPIRHWPSCGLPQSKKPYNDSDNARDELHGAGQYGKPETRKKIMGWEGWFTIGSVVLTFALLVGTRIGPEFILKGILTILITVGILDANEALIGMGNQGMVTVAILFVVAAGIRETGAISLMAPFLTTRPKSLGRAQLRMMAPISLMSSFLNNTPIVAIFIPAVSSWAKKFNLPVSKLMIPLSYAAILGGTCTLIGTSTNLIVNAMMMQETGQPSLSMFEIAKAGIPCAAVMMIFMIFVGTRFLPDRSSSMEQLDDPREYTVEMIVSPGGRLVSKTIEQAGLRELGGMYLVEIIRGSENFPVVEPTMKLQSEDRLVFTGTVDNVVDLQKVRGLTPVLDHIFNLDSARSDRCLIEVVVSRSCRLIGRSIVGGHFRQIYNAVVIAVSRSGHHLKGSIGDIVIQDGDTLLLESHPSFYTRHRISKDFFLISQLEDSSPPRHKKAILAFGILITMVGLATTGVMSMLNAAALAAGLLLVTRCMVCSQAMRSIDWQVLLVIISAFGIGKAMQKTGAAEMIATSLVGMVQGNPWLVLAVIYACTSLFTELITNNAGALLMFPIAMSTSVQMDVNLLPFVIAIMMGASASFATPIGYQTNMMVFGPGGYRFSDFLKIGIPMNLLMWLTASLLIPIIWPF